MDKKTLSSFPFHVMTKPIGPICNLDCKYCFYLEKEELYKGEGKWRMAPELLESYVKQYIEAQPTNEVSFAWQGGEPTLLGVDFFRRVVELQKKYANGKVIDNAFQTNATLLDDDWALFFKENDFLVGVSIDGPKEVHDHYRVDKSGGSSFDRVMAGIKVLQKHDVRFNTLTCVNRVVSKKPLEVYRFLKGIGSSFMQFIPIVERRPGKQAKEWGLELACPEDSGIDDDDLPVTSWSVRPKDFGDFYTKIFDRWVQKDVGKIYIQLVETAFTKWIGVPGGICVHNETCGSALAVEHNGDMYSCDHFVYPQYRLGNIKDTPMAEMVQSPAQKKFGLDKRDRLPQYCRDCEVRFICHGACPKDRFLKTPDGESGLHYLCAGYRAFFNHMTPVMREMTRLYRNKASPAGVMELVKGKKIEGYRPGKK